MYTYLGSVVLYLPEENDIKYVLGCEIEPSNNALIFSQVYTNMYIAWNASPKKTIPCGIRTRIFRIDDPHRSLVRF
jgi:hypothetical protein